MRNAIIPIKRINKTLKENKTEINQKIKFLNKIYVVIDEDTKITDTIDLSENKVKKVTKRKKNDSENYDW